MLRRANPLQPAVESLSTTVQAVLDNQKVVAELTASTARNAQLERDLAVAQERIKHLESEVRRLTSLQPSSFPLYWTEEEEDALHAHRSGDIDATQLEEILKAAGFEHGEVEFEADSYPRLSQLTS